VSELWQILLVVIVSPVVLSVTTYFIQRSSKREDWRRQDEVATLLRVGDKSTKKRLEDIHILVNSTLTESKQGQLDANRLIVALVQRDENNITLEERTILNVSLNKIKILEAELKDREVQQTLVDKEQR
jgi:hypothetical protein